jgi:hypothetical protein
MVRLPVVPERRTTRRDGVLPFGYCPPGTTERDLSYFMA